MDPAWLAIFEEAEDSEHIALVYRDQAFLARAVAHWSAPPLRAGGGAILVGTAAHMLAVREELRRLGVDGDRTERSGQLVFIDAEWLMGQFILDGTPNAEKFNALAGEIIRGVQRATGSRPARVRAWGEMVSLLRLRGDPAAARRLEELWTNAIGEHGIALLCSYDLEGRQAQERGAFHADVAHSHDRLVLQPEIGMGPAAQRA